MPAPAPMKFAAGLVAVAAVIASSHSFAQATSGSFSSGHPPPAWGHPGATTWGTYSNSLGKQGWNYNQTQQPYEPAGTVLLPNQSNSNFSNPRTGAGLFNPQDTRFKSRDRP